MQSEEGIEPDVQLLNCLISVCGHAGQVDRAAAILADDFGEPTCH